ncbi:uncharacterized protein LOC131479061 [Ochotona princeps]|uniref:uncharacterized protein LOC131479061 n=1 Tax=Ochotona princeps TaxID=9978 RepID=UPI0027151616|nr:uncharacterized protein LOC131479061 [Ochotona princeps]
MEHEGNRSSNAASAAAEERASSTSSSSSGSNADSGHNAATVDGGPCTTNDTAETQKTESELLKEKASEGLRVLIEQKPPSTPDGALLQQHEEKHVECAQLLEHMQRLLVKRLYHEFTLASMAYLAPLALLETSSSTVEMASDRANSAGPLAAAAALSFPPFPAGYPTFAPFERVTFFHRLLRSRYRTVNVRFSATVQMEEKKKEEEDNDDDEVADALLVVVIVVVAIRLAKEQQEVDLQQKGVGVLVLLVVVVVVLQLVLLQAASLAGAASALEAELLFRSCESYHYSRYDHLTESEEILEDLKKKLSVTMGVSPVAQAAFHRAAATLAKAQDKYADFYHQAMMFLAYTPAASIPENERVGLAYEVAIAALVAPDIFNFGELLQQALVISSLQLPEHRWLYDLVDAFHCGSMAKYDDTCNRFGHQIQSTALAAHMPALRRKISISALLRLAFTHSAAGAATAATAAEGPDSSNPLCAVENNTTRTAGSDLKPMAARSLSFQAVASTCKVALDEVELLVMSAMSKQLLRGSIDQVNREVNISWVRPALLLDETGMACLQERLLRWVASAQQLHQHLQGQTAELLGS